MWLRQREPAKLDSPRFDVAKGHAFGLHADAAGGRCLAGGEAVDLIVQHDVEQVEFSGYSHERDDVDKS